MRSLAALVLVAACGLAACKPGAKLPADAVLLYDVDFSAPENAVGSVPKLAEPNAPAPFPRKTPTDVFMGEPKVVDALCGLKSQPVKLSVASGTQGLEGLLFLIDTLYGHYRIELDVCVQHLGQAPLQASEPQLAIFVDMPQAFALGFFEGGRLVLIDQGRGVDAIVNPNVIGKYEIGKPLHIAIDVDVSAGSWSIAGDGKELYAGKVGTVMPSAIRVVLRGNAQNEVAFDNLVVWGEHDLSGADTESLSSEPVAEGAAGESEEVPK